MAKGQSDLDLIAEYRRLVNRPHRQLTDAEMNRAVDILYEARVRRKLRLDPTALPKEP